MRYLWENLGLWRRSWGVCSWFCSDCGDLRRLLEFNHNHIATIIGSKYDCYMAAIEMVAICHKLVVGDLRRFAMNSAHYRDHFGSKYNDLFWAFEAIVWRMASILSRIAAICDELRHLGRVWDEFEGVGHKKWRLLWARHLFVGGGK